jgi:hypothetical protein
LFEWKGKQQRLFNLLKRKLLSELVLWFPDSTKPFKVHTYVSGFVIGRVLM